MNKIFLLLFVFICLTYENYAQVQAPSIQWQASFGTDTTDWLISAMVDQHGHIYLFVASDQTGINGDKLYTKGNADGWLIKLDANGQKLWDTVYGGSGSDWALLGEEYDGEILLSCFTDSKDGDISDTISRGMQDIWLMNIDANGRKIWDKRIGTSTLDWGHAIRVQNGYLLAAQSHIADGDRTVPYTYGNSIWLVKLNNSGLKQWEKSFGVGTGIQLTYRKIIPTADGGSMIMADTRGGIGGDKTDTARGLSDVWLIKLDANGNIQWDKTLGNPNEDGGSYQHILQCPDGTYFYAGFSVGGNGGDKTSGYIDGEDIWVVKMDANGQILWDKTIGTNQADFVYNLSTTADNGIILACSNNGPANHDKTENGRGLLDYWLVRMDSNGNILWDKTLGGDLPEWPVSVKNLGSNGILLAGTSYSGISGEKTSASRGDSDIWVVKLGPEQTNGVGAAAGYPQLINAFPNPVNSHLYFSQTADVQICNLEGKLIHAAQQVDQISVAHLSNGVYIVQYKAPNGLIWQSVQMIKK